MGDSWWKIMDYLSAREKHGQDLLLTSISLPSSLPPPIMSHITLKNLPSPFSEGLRWRLLVIAFVFKKNNWQGNKFSCA